ncbi:hypothetical protein DFH06DRAFT_1202823 [Mycena polygramma]|nr:hypothetical protein DFH06DRAFT_1202823 [Mycena polygramma]
MKSMASDGNSMDEAFCFSSSMLPNPRDTKLLRDSLRENYLPLARETTRLRATISSTPPELALYEKHLSVLVSAQETLSKAITRLRTESNRLLEYSDICSSTLAPIRRLPPELLNNIFLLCSTPPRDLTSLDYAAEIHRLARRDLMQLAHVCAHWRALVLGTPAFWRIIDVDLMFWSHKMLPLVQTALTRSASTPLFLRLGAPEDVAVDRSLLELVAQHSSRWQAVGICMDFPFYSSLSSIRGNLPLLESAHIAGVVDPDDVIHTTEMANAAVKLFSVAPRLAEVTYTGPPLALKFLPWIQLKRFEYLDLLLTELSDALSALQYFPPGMQFELRRLLCQPDPGDEFIPPPTVSNLTDFIVEFAFPCSDAIAYILNRLTLPCLSYLELLSLNYKDAPLTWNQPAFHAFYMRSGCHKTLTSLFLLHVAISPDELLDCVADLRALQGLVVADHPSVSGKPEHILLTDEVFRGLAETGSDSEPRLLPKLAVFGVLVLLPHFNEVAYLDFVRSRVVARKEHDFESHVRWYPGSAREVKPAVLEELQRLAEEKALVASIEVANEEELQTF